MNWGVLPLPLALTFSDSMTVLQAVPDYPQNKAQRNMPVATFQPHLASRLSDRAFTALPDEPPNSPEEPVKGHVEPTVYESLGSQAYKMGGMEKAPA